MSDSGSGRQWRPPGLQDRVETEAVAPGGGGQLGGRLQPPQGDPRGVRWHRQSEVLDCGYSHLLPVMWTLLCFIYLLLIVIIKYCFMKNIWVQL